MCGNWGQFPHIDKVTVPNFPIARAAGLLAVSLCVASGCTARNAPVDPHKVTLMTFNVENLFDTTDDPGKDDRTFLPLAAKHTDAHRTACATIEVDRWREQCLHWDWSDELLTRKLEVVAEAILQVDGGHGPDIVALQEVENLAVLERLRTDYLAAANYLPAILVEGADARGIDVAFLSRLPLVGAPVLHGIAFPGVAAERVADTRGLLEATFRLPDGTLLTGYSVHFPAPFHPTEMRVAAYEALNRRLADLPAGRPAFAAGDFNTTAAEDGEQQLLDRLAAPQWTIAHRIGCAGCPGTQYYAPADSWSFLDMILYSPARRGENATWRIRADSVHLANNTPAQVREDGTPARFDAASGAGVSDHWPLMLTLESK